ncbi:aspartyl protease family protein At5g10770-like [Ananas comosus]|uniref:Aspartyl protease family protein At5g10770-like n=1 Tax=Ananas comosus TaxID=4615 RepID=A0A6P5F4T4_ANACO|nr:aspartyl protease family protein At5g10770-like [Ananas comosus]
MGFERAQLFIAVDSSKLSVVHRHGPCSPLGQPKRANHRRNLREDHFRVRSIHHRISTNLAAAAAAPTLPSHLGLSLGTADYIVTVGIGTPKRDLSLVFDTGSDLTWTQCEPCTTSCYSQKEPMFDPQQSSSYSNISCSTGECSLASSQSGCLDSTCIYLVQYGDGSYSSGFFAEETLTLTPSDVVTTFKFGCGESNIGLFGGVAGLLGLGRGQVSLVSQSADQYGGVFSYCLPPFASSAGYLTFGASSASPNMQFTPLQSNSAAPSFYFVEMVGISVGGKVLPIQPEVFSTAATIVDSGTVLTRLPMSAYTALRDEFRSHMSGYPTAPPLSILDTCYDLTGHDNVSVPGVAMQFGGGVNLNVDASGILYVADISQACLAFVGNVNETDVSIVGNMQQKTYSVVFDAPNNVIGFGAGGCS